MPKADIPIQQHQFSRVVPTNGIAVREDVLFSNHKGEEKAAIRKRNVQALEKLRPALQRLLSSDEAVLYIARARTQLSVVEQLTAGWWTYLLTNAALVFTNQRVLFFPVKTDGQWRESVRSAQWGDLAKVEPHGFLNRSVTFTFRNGQTITYIGFRRAEARKIAHIAESLLPASLGEQSAGQGIVQVCPDCRGPLTPGVYSCNACGLVFKNEKTMLLRSIFLPAGGYFYTGHPMIAILPALVEIIFLIDVLGLILVRHSDPNAAENLGGALIVVFFFWAIETAITILHCRRYIREYIPQRRTGAARSTLATDGSASI